MRRAVFLPICCVLLGSASPAPAQTPANSSLSGKYFFVQLLVTISASTGLPVTVANLGGSMTFNGSGSYSYSGNVGTNSAADIGASGNGSYAVSSDGSVALTDPLRPDLSINARLSADHAVVLGSATEDVKDITSDLFVAVKAPSGGISNALLNGTYYGSTMSFPNGSTQFLSSSLVSFVANGQGQFTSASITGHEADQFDMNVVQSLSGAAYSINADGTGTATFGPSSASTLLNGNRNIFVSADGNYVIGFSTTAGGRDIFVAAKAFSSAASSANLSGRYWIAELDYDDFQGNVSSGSGAFAGGGNQSNILSERLSGAFSFSSLYYDSVNANGLGQFDTVPELSLINMALGAPSGSGAGAMPNAMVGAQIDLPGYESTYYGVFLAVRAPTFSGSGAGVFLNPTGVVNAASFAPAPNAIAPGEIVALFGSNLSAVTDRPSTIPLQPSDQGVSVTLNGIAAPLFYVSSGQINIQVPFQLAGSSSATIQVINNGQASNLVTVPLASGDPAIFMWTDLAGPYHAAVVHLDGTQVDGANPAMRGETVEVFATGLGTLSPAVPTGAANPGPTPAASPDKFVNVFFDGEQGSILFAGGAPTFVGLDQINVVIPADATTGPQVSLQIESSWGYSNFANIPIQ